jgi:alpha-1,2-mannosyltransferase
LVLHAFGHTPVVEDAPERATRSPAWRSPAHIASWTVALLLCLAGCAFFIAQSRSWNASGLDVGIYRDAARAFAHGQDVYAGRYGSDGGGLPFTYPPFALLVLLPLAALSSRAAEVAMFAASACALTACVRWSQRYALGDRMIPWWSTVALAGAASYFVEPVRTTLGLGQINLILLVLVLGLDARARRGAGAGAGLAAAVKVTPALLVIAQAVRGDVRAFMRGVVAFAAGTGVAAVLAPSATWHFFSSLMWDPARTGGVAYIGNQSLRGVWERLVPSHSVSLWAVSSLVVLGVAAWGVRRHRCDPWFSLTIAAVAGLLVSPISWTHHWVWVLPVVAIGIRHRRERRALTVACLLFLLPCLAQTVLWSRAVAPAWSVDMYALAGLVWIAVASQTRPTTGPPAPVSTARADATSPAEPLASATFPDVTTVQGPTIDPG